MPSPIAPLPNRAASILPNHEVAVHRRTGYTSRPRISPIQCCVHCVHPSPPSKRNSMGPAARMKIMVSTCLTKGGSDEHIAFHGRATTWVTQSEASTSGRHARRSSKGTVMMKGILIKAAIVAGCCLLVSCSHGDRDETTQRKLELYDNGQIESVVTTDGPHKTVEFWLEDVSLSMRNRYVDGKLHGLQEQWYADGNRVLEEHYYNGVKHGKQLYWHPDGSLHAEGFSVDGKTMKGISYRADGSLEAVMIRRDNDKFLVEVDNQGMVTHIEVIMDGETLIDERNSLPQPTSEDSIYFK